MAAGWEVFGEECGLFKKILIGLLLSQACWQPVGWLAEASVLPDTQGALQQERGGRAPVAVSRQKPAALKPGDCIGILAPACNVGDRDIVRAIDWLHQLGYRTKLAPSASAVWGYLAGSDSQRAADVNAFFADDGVQARIYGGSTCAVMRIHNAFEAPFESIPTGWQHLVKQIEQSKDWKMSCGLCYEEVVNGEEGNDLILYLPVHN